MSVRLVCGDDLRPWLPDIAELLREHPIDIPPQDMASMQAIAAVADRVLAVVFYSHFNGADVQMHITSRDPRWCSRGTLRGFFHYPFEQLRVRRVTAIIRKKNRRARRMNERLGFTLEGVHPQCYPDGATAVSYGMTRDRCKWL